MSSEDHKGVGLCVGAPALELLRMRIVLVSVDSTDETLAWSGIVWSSRGLSDVDPILELFIIQHLRGTPVQVV